MQNNQEKTVRDMNEECAEISSVAVPNATENTGVLSMVQEACDSVMVLGEHYRADPHAVKTEVLQDLKEYFRRPVVAANFTFNLNTVIPHYTLTIDSTTLPTLFSGFANRLLGVAGLAFDLVFTLQVSASPFNQGVVAMCWQYDVGNGTNLDRTIIPAMCTNLPHVRLDLSENTMVQLRIPFLNAQQFFDIRNTFSYGKMAMNSILPVRVGVAGNSAPTYHILVHLENLKLYHAAPISTTPVVFQAGGKKPIEEEFENEAYPYSSGLYAFGRTLKWVARGVPSLSSLAGPTSWFLGKAAGAIRAFGFSKPLVQEPARRVWNDSTIMEHNVDVPSSALMVGALASNRLKVDENIACSDVDEMSLSYLTQQWSQLGRFNMATTDTPETLLWGTPVSLACFWFKGAASAASLNRNPILSSTNFNAFIPTTLFWWGQCFKQWRGDLEFRFTFAKTKMHAGRVIVAYNPIAGTSSRGSGPNTTASTIQTTATNAMFGYSAIFDLKDNNVFTFDVPYYSSVGYTDFNSYTGALTLKVYDSLLATGVTSTNIQVLVEVRAKPGFEMAIPSTIDYVPASNTSTVIYQSGVVKVIREDFCEQAVGEQINSVKQLISIPSVIITNTNYFVSTAIPGFNALTQAFSPWFTRPTPPAAAVPNTIDYLNINPRNFNFGAYASNAYLYARGSTDLHFNVVGPNRLTFSAWQQLPNSSLSQISRTIANMMTWSTGFSAHFRFPGYQYAARTSLQSTLPATASAINVPVNYVADNYQCGVKIMNGSSTANYYQTRLSAGDDAMLGHYIGPTYLALAATDGQINDAMSTFYTSTGVVTPPAMALLAPAVDVPVVDPVVESALPALKVNTLVSPFEPTPPPPITSGDEGVFPSARAGGLTRSLPRAGRVNVEEVKSILDSLVES
nr:MAG: hypothetical protein 2 [Picornavirales sp.]